MPKTIKDVARHAGVSSATVSRVLSAKPHVTEEVRKRVFCAIEELNYQPNRVARSLRVQRTRTIGLIISDIQNPFFLSLVRAVEDVASAHQYATFLCNTDEDLAKEQLYINLMLAENIAGVIISPSQEKNDPCRELLKAKVPLVVIDRRLSDVVVDTVRIDNLQAAFTLVDHLCKDGYKRIGALLGVPTATTGRERFEGYLQALAAHHIPFQPELLRTGIPKEIIGYQLASELLELPTPPRALFTGNNLLTTGALRAIFERGLRIPDDIALGAFDDSSWMTLIKPALTVVAQPTYELGYAAARLLLQRMEDNERPTQEVLLKTALLVRQSCYQHEHMKEMSHRQ